MKNLFGGHPAARQGAGGVIPDSGSIATAGKLDRLIRLCESGVTVYTIVTILGARSSLPVV